MSRNVVSRNVLRSAASLLPFGLPAAVVLAWRPGWREYVAEVVVGLALVLGGRDLGCRLPARYPLLGRTSRFDEAVRRTAEPAVVPSELLQFARSAAVLGGPWSLEQRVLLAAAAQRRLQARHSCDLDSDRARALLGDHVYHLLTGAITSLHADDARAALDVLEGL